MGPDDELMRVRAVGEMLDTSDDKVRALFREGVLKGTRLSPRNIRIFRSSVEELIARGSNAACTAQDRG